MDLITLGLSFKTSDSSGNVCAYFYQIPKFFYVFVSLHQSTKWHVTLLNRVGLEIEKHEMKIKTTGWDK